MMSLLTAPMATDHDSMILPELDELAQLCRQFADSDCCDTEVFRAIVRATESLSREIPPVCVPLTELVYLVLMVFKARPADLDRNSVHAIACALDSVDTMYLEPEALAQIRGGLAEAGLNLRPF